MLVATPFQRKVSCCSLLKAKTLCKLVSMPHPSKVRCIYALRMESAVYICEA